MALAGKRTSNSKEDYCRRTDHKPPLLDLQTVLNGQALKEMQAVTRSLDIANMTNLSRLLNIHITGGMVDSFWKSPRPKITTKKYSRKIEEGRIKMENKYLAKTLRNARPVVPTVISLNESWQQSKALIHPMPDSDPKLSLTQAICSKKEQYVTTKSLKYADKRPRVLIEIAGPDGTVMGTLKAVLYSDHLPNTTSQFLQYIKKFGQSTNRGYIIYAVLPNYYCMSGLEGSLNQKSLERDTCNPLSHSRRGILSSYNIPTNVNGTQFIITFNERKALDENYYPFGKVEAGFRTLRIIESVGTPTGYPKMNLFVSNIFEI